MQRADLSTKLDQINQKDGKSAKLGCHVNYLDVPVKSESDKKEYRVIKLENGLTALLIADLQFAPSATQEEDDGSSEGSSSEYSSSSEEETEEDEEEDNHIRERDAKSIGSKEPKRDEKMAACGLCVGVGTFSDPPEIPGMAHFLEHMLFLGSEKYPEENDFDAFIKKHGGSDNAYTSCEHTIYHFEIQEKHLFPALDRFAQFFISPLMKRDAITREREAIESEFKLALPSDPNRAEQLLCSFAQPGHPVTKFSWGNLITLRDNVTDDKLYEELHNFKERHYSAHRMTLALQAQLPLDTLEQYVKECFNNVPSNNLPPHDFSKFIGPQSFDTPSFKRMYKIKPISDVCQLELTWALPPLHHLYKSKPQHYLGWLTGHEGKGSLSSYLRKKMWVLNFDSGTDDTGFDHSSMCALFSMNIHLTDNGYEHLKEIIDAVFAYIKMLQKEGPQETIFNEIQQIGETNFRFMNEQEPDSNVQDLCENMHFFPPSDYITGSELYFEYNPACIKECLDYLTPENVNIIIMDKRLKDDELPKVEPWFGTQYGDMDIPPEWILDWKAIEPLPEFHLPEPNVFVTYDFTRFPIPEDVSKYPVKILEDSICELWYRPDTYFGRPECYMRFYFIIPMALATPQSAAMLDLYVKILLHLLAEELYPANVADLYHNVSVDDKGLSVSVDGYNEKLPLLLTAITNYIADCSKLVTEELFEIMKKEQLKGYYNTFINGEELLSDVRFSILMLSNWTSYDKHAAVTGVDFRQFQTFAKHLMDHVYIQALVQGNITEADVIKHGRNCIEILKCGPLVPNSLPHTRVNQIPLGQHCCRVKNFNSMDVNSIVTNYYQSGPADIRTSIIIDLILMIMEEPLFNQLRTQEQLGYDVSCTLRDTFGILGYSITVCTPVEKFSTDHVDERIEIFLKSFLEKLNDMPAKEFEDLKKALAKLKQCVDVQLKQEVDRNWGEIKSRNYMFGKLDKELAAIKEVTLEELKTWMQRHVTSGQNLRKLSIQIVGTASKKTAEKIDDVIQTDVNSGDSSIKANDRIKYELQFLTNKINRQENQKDVYYINNIQDFKDSLFVYPVSRLTS
ncbi:nardilysin isoform X2 [Orussus abietinus]|nr:nardilysin isoform X2 [Orussus abietinus]